MVCKAPIFTIWHSRLDHFYLQKRTKKRTFALLFDVCLSKMSGLGSLISAQEFRCENYCLLTIMASMSECWCNATKWWTHSWHYNFPNILFWKIIYLNNIFGLKVLSNYSMNFTDLALLWHRLGTNTQLTDVDVLTSNHHIRSSFWCVLKVMRSYFSWDSSLAVMSLSGHFCNIQKLLPRKKKTLKFSVTGNSKPKKNEGNQHSRIETIYERRIHWKNSNFVSLFVYLLFL